MRALAVVAALVIVSASAGCAHARVLDAVVPRVVLPGTDGVAHELGQGTGGAALSVLVFFAQHCPCQAAHDARLLEVARRYHDRGVEVFAIDPEPGATPEGDATEAARRGYPFPILVDHGGALARRLGAEYATESFVIDRKGVVRFHGGIDSDKSALHDDARPYLRDALDDLLLGRAPRLAEAKAFGCALQLW